MGRFSMSKTMTAAVTFGLFILLVAGLATGRCRRGSAPAETVVIIDTVQPADSVKATKHTRSNKKRKVKVKKAATPPSSRNYLDEPAD